MDYPYYIERAIQDTSMPVDELISTIDAWLDPFVKSGNNLIDDYLNHFANQITTEDYIQHVASASNLIKMVLYL